jgi:hypothetical protein
LVSFFFFLSFPFFPSSLPLLLLSCTLKEVKTMSGTDALLSWCQRYTSGYRGAEVKNFTTSWANGLAFCALIHNFRPELISYETLKPEEKQKNLHLAFTVADSLGIPMLMDVEDMLIPVPDRLSVITYVSQ